MDFNPEKEDKENKELAWARKASEMPWPRPLSNWTPVRLSGRLRWRYNSHTNLSQQLQENEEHSDEPTCLKQFHEYCDITTMHGIRYIAEKQRTIGEKIFWSAWTVGMFCTAVYMMAKIYMRWESSPVITSVSNTNYPVTNINFPAVTICTVNKAVNEKMIIQACRYNMTLSQIRGIIATLVDPEARNNDNLAGSDLNVHPKMAIKYLRLTTPKCENYLLTCRWNNSPIRCSNLFKLTLTDSGYCCTFNAIPLKYRKSDPKNDLEVATQEAEFDYLQQAVWDYTDRFREKNGPPGDDGDLSSNSSTYDASCSRIYDDDLFPGICKYIQKCRDNPVSCKLNAPASIGPPVIPNANNTDNFPWKATGAGRSRGLTIMLDTLRCDAVPTDSFKGMRVFVHDPDEFAAVGERGFIVGPGMENQVTITGTDVDSEDILLNFSPKKRGCYFSNEFKLKNYNDYSRSSCVVECETEFIYRECQCTPYFSPGNYTTCTVDKINGCVKKAIDTIQKKQKAVAMQEEKIQFKFKKRDQHLQEKTCTDFCLPPCYETSYNTVITAASFPNQQEPNKTKIIREAIAEHSQLNDINYITASISVLRVFFRSSSVVQFKRDEKFAWEDFVSNLGGVMGLCLGFSILSIVELIYFFTLRLVIDVRRYNHNVIKQPQDFAIRGM